MEVAFLVVLLLVVLVGGGIAVAVSSARQRERAEAERTRLIEERVARIRRKYGHTEEAEKIIQRQAWVGQTAEQLQDSIGPPEDIDEKVLKTKKKEVWKYQRTGANRYALRITLENDRVIGWDEKL